MACAAGCHQSPFGSEVDPFAGRERTRFELSALVADGFASSTPTTVSACRTPIRGRTLQRSAWPPEVGLTVRVSRTGSIEHIAVTGDDGRAALPNLAGGVHVLELVTGDGLLRGQFPITTEVRRIDLFGQITVDADDIDQDGDRNEWVLAVEVLPDDDSDGISDTGLRALWVFGMDDGVGFRHLGGGFSEKLLLDSAFNIIGEERFPDRDGDFVADDDDPDIDGDGVANASDVGELPCPGVTHDQYWTAGSKHENFKCERCHLPDATRPYGCEDCHTPQGPGWDPTKTDNRPAGHFELGCQFCHVPDQKWTDVPGPNGELHDDPFTLTGLHLLVDCFACHIGGTPKPPLVCEACHLQSAAVGHAQEGCAACHTPDGWLLATANHDQFPLNGGHAGVTCTLCHLNAPVYTGLSTACEACHTASAPQKHTAAGFSSQTCADCHIIVDWADYDWLHSAWLLAGMHARAPCGACHDSNPIDYTGLTRGCQSCHAADTPVWPNHGTWGTACTECHDQTGWLPVLPGAEGRVDHSIWPLVDTHLTVLCTACHGADGSIPQPSRNCSACHDIHRPARHAGTFDGECDQCHRATQWADLTVTHVHIASFPLVGSHADAVCSRCHPTSYAVSAACIDCHAANEPSGHYGNACGDCHDEAQRNWDPTGDMNHHTSDPTALPLTGGHALIVCSDCHTNGFDPLPRACESCHTNSMPVGHARTRCADCHTAGTWNNANPPPNNALHPLQGGHIRAACEDCHGPWSTAGQDFQTPRPDSRCDNCHSLPSGHIGTGTQDCDNCHDEDAWLPATSGGHTGSVATGHFPYDSWSSRWFPFPHHGAKQCDDCHTRISNLGYQFYDCTWQCHDNRSRLNGKHNDGQDNGTEAKKQFHLYHFSSGDSNSPPDEGGATWPTGHVGCSKAACHADGRRP